MARWPARGDHGGRAKGDACSACEVSDGVGAAAAVSGAETSRRSALSSRSRGEPSERLERDAHVGEIALHDETSPERLLRRLPQQLR